MLYQLTALAFKLFNRQLAITQGVKIDPRAFIARGGPVILGAGTIVRAGSMLLPSGGSITIGAHSSVNQYVVMNGMGGIRIGDNVMIAAFCSMFAANHIIDRTDIPMRQQGMVSKGGIVVEDDVWLGTHTVILDGVTVGRGSVVAAGAVVSHDVEPYNVVGGVPARCIGVRGTNS